MSPVMLLLAMAACDSEVVPYATPTPPVSNIEGSCSGFVTTGRLRLGGAITAATTDGVGRLFVATEEAVEVYALDDPSAPADYLEVRGEIRDVTYAAGALWIAAGSGGIARWRPGQATPPQRWARGGDIQGLTASGGRMWGADGHGRVWAVPLEPVAGDEAVWVSVDGWPTRIVPWAGGVVIDGPETPRQAVEPRDGGIQLVPGLTAPPTTLVAARDGVLYSTTINTVRRRHGNGRIDTISLPFDILAITASASGSVFVGDGGMVYKWDLEQGDAQPMMDERLPFDAISIEITDDAAVFAGLHAVAWARRGPGGWSLAHTVRREIGEIAALARVPGGLVVGTAREDGTGHLIRVARPADGDGLEVTGTLTTGAVTDLLVMDDTLLVAHASVGLSAIDLDRPPSSWTLRTVGLPGEHLLGLAPIDSRRLVALSHARGVVWLERTGSGWRDIAGRSFDLARSPVDIAVMDGGQVVVSFEGSGVVRRIADADSAVEQVLLGGTVFNDSGRCPCGGTLLAHDGALWVPSPLLGMQRVSFAPDAPPSALMIDGGAWDATPVGDQIVAALGRSGVAMIRTDADGGMAVRNRCDLSGDVRRVVSIDDRVYAASGGTLVELTPR